MATLRAARLYYLEHRENGHADLSSSHEHILAGDRECLRAQFPWRAGAQVEIVLGDVGLPSRICL